MSDPTPATAGPAAVRVRKRTCGWLWLSLFATFSVYLLLIRADLGTFLTIYPWLGIPPIVGLFFGIVGYRAVKRDPNLIGPTFAWACMILAVFALGHQWYTRIGNADRVEWMRAAGEAQQRFVRALDGKDADELLASLAPSYRATHTGEEVKALLEKVFPGPDPVGLDLGKVETGGSKEEQQAEYDLLQTFLDKKIETVELSTPLIVSDRRGRISLEMHLQATRDEKNRILVEISDFSLERLPETPEPAEAGEAGGGGKPAAPEKPKPAKPDKPKESG